MNNSDRKIRAIRYYLESFGPIYTTTDLDRVIALAKGPGTKQPKLKPAPTAEEFVKMLENSLRYCKEADDRGSVDFCMGRWQVYWASTEPIFDEEGGI